MEVDASRIPGSSVLSSYPPPQSFDSYTLPSRGWTFPANDSHSHYMPSSQSNISAARDYRYNPGQEFFTHPPPPPMPVHNQSQPHLSHSHSHSGSHPHTLPPPSQSYHVPPESWSAPSPEQHQQHQAPSSSILTPPSRSSNRQSPSTEAQRAPNAALLYAQSQALPSSASLSLLSSSQRGTGAYSATVTRLPPILQVEKQQVTTSATQAASASRRRNEANFICPVPGCGSTFTRRFNLRGHLRSHTEERPFVCEWPGCGKGFARQHDCKRHQALHTSRSQSNVCQGCGKTFSRLDALNRHLRSEGGSECRQTAEAVAIAARVSPKQDEAETSKQKSSRADGNK
ncbi:hypothetical protein QCA50_009676 [Cerrena zonata]|uniref:C2H2-type domain-containing protein n=1 Tax=Cerrena zonata TaxID=2478898 RepID=A0AAW0G473_9APHY